VSFPPSRSARPPPFCFFFVLLDFSFCPGLKPSRVSLGVLVIAFLFCSSYVFLVSIFSPYFGPLFLVFCTGGLCPFVPSLLPPFFFPIPPFFNPGGVVFSFPSRVSSGLCVPAPYPSTHNSPQSWFPFPNPPGVNPPPLPPSDPLFSLFFLPPGTL